MTDGTEQDEATQAQSGEADQPPSNESVGEDGPATVEELQQALSECEDRYLRAVAELRNYRQRMLAQQAQQLQYAHDQLITALVPVLDHLELALHSARNPSGSPRGTLKTESSSCPLSRPNANT